MTRDDFLAEVRRLAEQFGVALWSIVERQTEAAKATALEVAMGQLRSEIADGEPVPVAIAGPEVRRRAQRRCSTCRETGHDARRCGRPGPERSNPSEPAATDQVATPADEPADPEPAASDEPEPDEQDDTDDDEAPSAAPSPPARANRFARIEAAAARRRGAA